MNSEYIHLESVHTENTNGKIERK